MWINELFLSNIQSYKNERITFSKGINLIIGKNNSGKSAIVRSLLNFQNGPSYKTISLLRKYETNGHVIAVFRQAKDVSFRGNSKATVDDIGVYYSAQNGGTWTFSPPSKIKDGNILKRYFDNLVNEKKYGEFERFDEENPVFIPLLARRKPSYFNGQLDKPSIKKMDLDFRGLPSKLHQILSGTLKIRFESYCNALLGFTPVMIAPLQNGTLDAGHGFGPGKDDQIPLNQMGDGVLQIAGLLINLLSGKGKIFLIEELENDLHPEVLKELLEIIVEYSKHHQFIITTHSNIVLKTLSSIVDSKIIEVKSELIKDQDTDIELFSSKTAIVSNTSEERLRVLQDLGYELFDNDLWAGFLILEEPSAEKVIRDFLIPEFCPKIKDKIKTISAKGADDVPARFIQLHRLFTYIHTTPVYKNKAWVIVDGDDAGKNAIERLKHEAGFARSWPPEHFMIFEEPAFENYYPAKYQSEINHINRINDGQKKGTLKVELAKKIVDDYYANRKELAALFELTASEVIKKLVSIQKLVLK
jgi:hypothetical protein